jgi:hypothetical protein
MTVLSCRHDRITVYVSLVSNIFSSNYSQSSSYNRQETGINLALFINAVRIQVLLCLYSYVMTATAYTWILSEEPRVLCINPGQRKEFK